MAEENKPDEELKLREEQDGSVVIGDEPPPKEAPEEPESDERLTASEDDGEDEAHSEHDTEEERAAKTERNRQRRKEGREKRREYVETLKRELAARDNIINEMSQRLSVVERKSSGSEMAQLETAEREAIQYYNHFKQLNQQAIEQANGAAATEAQEKMFAAKQRYDQIQNIKRAMQQRQQQPAPLDPRLVNHAQQWMEKNGWYDPNGSDEDSALVLSLDSRLAAQGWDPTTPQYWEELDARVKKYLPHRVNQGYNRQQVGNRPKVPVAGSGRESAASSNTSSSYRLSPERVQALKDAGLWDDPKARAAAIQRFQQYDKEQRT